MSIWFLEVWQKAKWHSQKPPGLQTAVCQHQGLAVMDKCGGLSSEPRTAVCHLGCCLGRASPLLAASVFLINVYLLLLCFSELLFCMI